MARIAGNSLYQVTIFLCASATIWMLRALGMSSISGQASCKVEETSESCGVTRSHLDPGVGESNTAVAGTGE